MVASYVTPEYRAGVKLRMLAVPIATTLTALICFWSADISVAIYLLLLPLYMVPGNFERERILTTEQTVPIRNEPRSHRAADT
jgi:hypothetical protein